MPAIEFTILLSVLVGALVGVGVTLILRKKVRRINESNKRFKSVFESIWRIEKAVLEIVDFEQATKEVVNIILTELGYVNYGYEVIVLTLVDQEKKGLRRIAISNTEAAGKFLQATPIPFNSIVIPFSAAENLSIKAINERKMFTTQNVSDVLEPALSKEWVDKFQQTLGIKTSMVFPIIAKEKVLGSLIFSLSKTKEEISEEEWSVLDSFVGAVGIALDNAILFESLNNITEQLRVANNKLKDLDKLKDEFVSLASHELRTPMTVIKSYVWLILNGKAGEISSQQRKYLETTYASTERLIHLVNDMLNISRIESGRITIEKKPVDLGSLLAEQVSQMVSRGDELGIKIAYDKPSDALVVNADAEKISQVVINLIGNSLKFTPRGGSIFISVADSGNGFMQVNVRDTGRGMSHDEIGKLFQKFIMVGDTHLTREKGQGTGLGLYLSKSLIEMHGGKIWAESEGEDKGTTFSFTIPLPASQAPANISLPPRPNPQV